MTTTPIPMHGEKVLKILHLASQYPSSAKPGSGLYIRDHVRAISIYSKSTVVAIEIHSWKKWLERVSWIDKSKDIEGLVLRLILPDCGRLINRLIVFAGMCFLAVGCQLVGGYDVIHAHKYYYAGPPALVLKLLFNRPTVLTEHWQGFRTRRLGWLQRIAAPGIRLFDMVSAVSQDLAQHIADLGGAKRIVKVSNAIDPTLFRCDTHVRGSEVRLICVAQLEPVKNIPFLLRGLARIRELTSRSFHLDVYGDGPERIVCDRVIEQLHLEDIVTMHGFQPKNAIADALQLTDIAILTSITENQPCALLEAMCCGVSFVAPAVGGIPELVSEFGGAMFSPGDMEEFVAVLLSEITSTGTKRRHDLAQRAQQEFSLNVIGRQFIHVYQQAARNRRS